MMGKPVSPSLTRESIQETYRLILGRLPSDKEVEGWLARAANTTQEALRRQFLLSNEFLQGLEKIRPINWTPAKGQVAIFIHIPKTAGSSLRAMLTTAYSSEKILECNDVDMSQLLEMPLERREELGAVIGHLTPGIGRHFIKRVVYLTTLRSPVERIYSFYRFIRRHSDHPVYEYVRGTNFGRFLEVSLGHNDLRAAVDNGQVRWLAGDMTTAAFGATPTLFRKAMHTLFAPNMIFGISEEFEEFIDLLVQEGIIPSMKEVRENVSPGTEASLEEALAEMTTDQRALLDAFTGWDNLLYETARAHVIGSKIARGQASS